MGVAQKKFGELPIDLVDGDRSKKYPKKSEFQVSGVPFLNSAAISGGRIKFSDSNYITQEKYETITKGRVYENDIVLTTRGNGIGKAALFTDGKYREALINAQMLVIKSRKGEIDPDYLFSLIQSEDFQSQLWKFASGSAQPQIPIRDLKDIPVNIVDYEEQKQIGAIIRAYDNLIENNNRRIAILEEMAQSLYREWFVNFRVPGYENTKFIDSSLGKIPEGWGVASLGEYLMELESGKRPKGGIKDIETGIPSVGAENINGIGRHKFTDEKLVPREFYDEMKKGKVQDRDVAIYKDGAYIGRSSYFRDNFPHEEFCVNEHVFLLRAENKRLTQNFLYLWLQYPETVSNIRATNANAAQPGINQQGIKGLKILIPTKEVMTDFDQLVEPLLAKLVVNAKRNRNLQKQRDLLLPKLISGMIELSN